MNINIMVKQAGKKRAITQLPFEVPVGVSTLRDLISAVVTKNVADYNAKKTDSDIVDILTKKDIEEQAHTGKVGFGRRFSDKDADREKACDSAILAFEDGLFRVFIDDEEVCGLNDTLTMREGSQVAFIRFTFLAGRMW